MVKSGGPDSYEGGNEHKTKHRQPVPPQASMH